MTNPKAAPLRGPSLADSKLMDFWKQRFCLFLNNDKIDLGIPTQAFAPDKHPPEAILSCYWIALGTFKRMLLLRDQEPLAVLLDVASLWSHFFTVSATFVAASELDAQLPNWERILVQFDRLTPLLKALIDDSPKQMTLSLNRLARAFACWSFPMRVYKNGTNYLCLETIRSQPLAFQLRGYCSEFLGGNTRDLTNGLFSLTKNSNPPLLRLYLTRIYSSLLSLGDLDSEDMPASFKNDFHHQVWYSAATSLARFPNMDDWIRWSTLTKEVFPPRKQPGPESLSLSIFLTACHELAVREIFDGPTFTALIAFIDKEILVQNKVLDNLELHGVKGRARSVVRSWQLNCTIMHLLLLKDLDKIVLGLKKLDLKSLVNWSDSNKFLCKKDTREDPPTWFYLLLPLQLIIDEGHGFQILESIRHPKVKEDGYLIVSEVLNFLLVRNGLTSTRAVLVEKLRAYFSNIEVEATQAFQAVKLAALRNNQERTGLHELVGLLSRLQSEMLILKMRLEDETIQEETRSCFLGTQELTRNALKSLKEMQERLSMEHDFIPQQVGWATDIQNLSITSWSRVSWDSSIRITVTRTEDFPDIFFTHRLILSAALTTLLTNAMEAIVQAKEIDPNMVGSMKVEAKVNAGMAEIWVQDNGVPPPEGVKKYLLPDRHVFSEKGAGRGSGLFINHWNLQMIGGRIQIVENPKAFVIIFPLQTNLEETNDNE